MVSIIDRFHCITCPTIFMNSRKCTVCASYTHQHSASVNKIKIVPPFFCVFESNVIHSDSDVAPEPETSLNGSL